MERVENEILSFVEHMEPQHWVIALAVMIVIGLVCLKGKGSKLHY